MGPGAASPFVREFFIFCKPVSNGTASFVIQIYFLSLINIVNKKIYRKLSLPGGCALSAIASAPANIIKC